MRWLWLFLVASLPATDFTLLPALRSGGQISFFLVLVLWAVLVWKVLIGDPPAIRLGRTAWWFVGFFVLGLFSIYIAATAEVETYRGESPVAKAAKQILQLAVSGTVYLLVPYFVKTREDLESVMRIWAGVFFAIVGLSVFEILSWFDNSAQLSGIMQVVHSPWTLMSPEYRRLRLLAPEPSMAANYLLAVIPFFLWRGFSFMSATWRRVGALASILVMALTFSLGGYLTFLLVLAAASFWVSTWRRRLVVMALIVLVVLLPLAVPEIGTVLGRLTMIAEDESFRARAAELHASFNTFSSRPFTGVGLGNSLFYFDRDYPEWSLLDPYVKYLLEASASGEQDLALNNLPVRILVEMGLIGFTVFMIWHGMVFWEMRKCLRLSVDPRDWDFSFSLLLALVGLWIHYAVTPGFHFRYLFLMLGLVSAWRAILQRTPPGPARASANIDPSDAGRFHA